MSLLKTLMMIKFSIFVSDLLAHASFVHWACATRRARTMAAAATRMVRTSPWTLPPPLFDDEEDRRVLSLGRASFCVILRSSPLRSLMSSYLV